ncbi:V-type immunoglobulin domain-containing suppressor of T-cell activation isoform 2-T2 [Trichechus inunguis]
MWCKIARKPLPRGSRERQCPPRPPGGAPEQAAPAALLTRSLCAHSPGGFPGLAASRPLLAHQKFPGAPASPLRPAAPDAAPTDGNMGVPTEAGGRRWGPVLLAVFLAASRGLVAAFKVATPYSLYVCPEGQDVTLTCRLLGPVPKSPVHDVTFYKTWYRSSRGEVQACSERRPIRNLTFQDLHLHHGTHQTANTSQDLAQRHGLESSSDHHGNFSITIRNLTLLDSGLYCCLVVEVRHHHSEQRVHGAMDLQVQTGKEASSKCIAYPPSPQESENITAAALATGACIVGILCLPLILLLVYKQRQAASNRRAQELVRMDNSNIQGIENPGFETSPPAQGILEAKPRAPLSYMAQRQPSESGRRLLSEPNTPLSPPGPGDVFFPSLGECFRPALHHDLGPPMACLWTCL